MNELGETPAPKAAIAHADPRPRRVLAIEPYDGGSHRVYLDGVVRHSRHQWSLLTAAPVHWKWRMRSAPLSLAAQLPEHLRQHGSPEVIWCSDMLDLPQWLGLAGEPSLLACTKLVYFHENQWTYPFAPGQPPDFHYGYTNLLTALAADVCLFNSKFHRDDFLAASECFVSRMPDTQACHDFARLRNKSQVVYPGYEPASASPASRTKADEGVLRIGWVSRWEHDKRPDRFVDLLRGLRDDSVDFRLILLGPRPRTGCAELETLRREFADSIEFDRCAPAGQDYWHQLARMDVVVSTADHEFFGMAICEAISAGAIAVVPNRLSYPEIVATATRYDSPAEAISIIKRLRDPPQRVGLVAEGQQSIAGLTMSHTIAQLDQVIDDLASPHLQLDSPEGE